MKRFIVTTALLLAAPFAFAAPATDAQVDKLMAAMRVRQTVDTVVPQMEASQKQMLIQMTAGQSFSAEQQRKLDAIVAGSSATMREMLQWERLQPLYRDIYRDTFSAEDIDAMVGFYSTPAGQRVLDKTPVLMQNTMAAMQKLIVPMLQKLESELAAHTRPGPATLVVPSPPGN